MIDIMAMVKDFFNRIEAVWHLIYVAVIVMDFVLGFKL